MVDKDKYIAIDLETTGLNWTKCGLIGIGTYSKEDKSVTFSNHTPENINEYQCIYHNGSFDIKVARKHGIILPYDHDTILMASLLQFKDNIKDYYRNEVNDRKLEESLSLDQLAIRHLGIKGDWKINWEKDHPDYDTIKEHCIMDCRVTYYLFELYKENLIKYNLWDYYIKLLMPLARLLVDIECVGIHLDIPKLLDMKLEYGEKLHTWGIDFQRNNKEALDIVIKHIKQDKIKKCKPGKNPQTLENRKQKVLNTPLEFNINSHVHMSKLLELKDISLTDKYGKHTSASKLLYRYEHDPIIGQIVQYKKLNKVYRDFLCKWDEMRNNETLHTSFRLWATRTGRLSSAEPNLQQVPKESEIRSLFIPREGFVFTVADAKQLEARLAAFFSNEEGLIKSFKEDMDVYGQIAIDLMGLYCHPNEVKQKFPKERAIGKQLFLATIYGQGSNSLYYLLTKEFQVNISLEECQKYKRLFNKTYPKLKEFAERCKLEAETNGYITTWFGRKIFIPNDKSYKAINSYIQGSGSDLIGFSQLNMIPNLPDTVKLLLLVHDEVVYEHKPEDTDTIVDTIRKYMVQYIQDKYSIPIDMDIKTGDNWGIK